MITKKGCKFFKFRLTYIGDDSDYLGKLNESLRMSTLNQLERTMFSTMFSVFHILNNIKCPYFKRCLYTDGKYSLNVRKDLNDVITILFDVDPNYTGDWLNGT